jgi:hypothetical protein
MVIRSQVLGQDRCSPLARPHLFAFAPLRSFLHMPSEGTDGRSMTRAAVHDRGSRHES